MNKKKAVEKNTTFQKWVGIFIYLIQVADNLEQRAEKREQR